MNKSTAKSDVGIVGTWNAGQNGGPMLWVDHILNHYYLTLNAGSVNYVDFGQGPPSGSGSTSPRPTTARPRASS